VRGVRLGEVLGDVGGPAPVVIAAAVPPLPRRRTVRELIAPQAAGREPAE
jgi:hypothetical protein